jgi:hypothetical protein
MDCAPFMHESGPVKPSGGEANVAPLSDGGADGGIAKSAARAGQHAIKCMRVDVALARGGQHADLDHALLVQERRCGAGHQPRPLALECFGRVEQVQPYQPIEQADGHAPRAPVGIGNARSKLARSASSRA